VLRDLASQENCDGIPYDQMIEAAKDIDALLAALRLVSLTQNIDIDVLKHVSAVIKKVEGR